MARARRDLPRRRAAGAAPARRQRAPAIKAQRYLAWPG
jgi:hypothetical protein